MNQQLLVLPPGWVEAIDPKSLRKYYANPTTKETRWDPPPDAMKVTQTPPVPSVSGTRATSSTASPLAPQSANSLETISRTGNPLYTATKNLAWDKPSELVSMTRSMLNKAAAFPSETVASDLELQNISPGQIADLCHLQRKSKTTGQNIGYTPLNPFRLSTLSEPDETEEARLDVRIHTLKEKLQKFGGASVACVKTEK
jgi:hypothetical protein